MYLSSVASEPSWQQAYWQQASWQQPSWQQPYSPFSHHLHERACTVTSDIMSCVCVGNVMCHQFLPVLPLSSDVSCSMVFFSSACRCTRLCWYMYVMQSACTWHDLLPLMLVSSAVWGAVLPAWTTEAEITQQQHVKKDSIESSIISSIHKTQSPLVAFPDCLLEAGALMGAAAPPCWEDCRGTASKKQNLLLDIDENDYVLEAWGQMQ